MSALNLCEEDRRALAKSAVRVLDFAQSPAPLLLICEHAGNSVPSPWQTLGLAPAFLDTHFAWDIGAAAVSELLAERLRATLVLGVYSRLFLDLNRFPHDWDCLRPDVGGIPVSGNLRADARDRALREEIARAPFDETVTQLLNGKRAVVSIHSFTPVMQGKVRDTEIGVLWRNECGMGEPVLAALRSQGGFVVGSNEPYDWHVADGYTLRRHGLDRSLPCLYLEVRNDLLANSHDRTRVADALASALQEALNVIDGDQQHG